MARYRSWWKLISGLAPLAAVCGAPVEFHRDIAPLLHRHCAECHRAGQVAPFPLLTYADAAPRAATIARVTASRAMPPWKAEPGAIRFQGERRLAPAEIARIRRWAESGAPEGAPTDVAPPQFPSEWRLGPPDLVVEMAEAFQTPAAGSGAYRCFAVPLPLQRDRFVRAFEFQPGNRRVLHHALIFADSSGTARKRGGEDGSPGYPCFGVPGFLPAASLGGWTPGMTPLPFPGGIAVSLRRGWDLVFQIHYQPTGKPEQDRSRLALYFSDQPPSRRLLDVALGSREIDIPPGDASYRVRDHFTLPVAVQLIGLIPHAHYICRQMTGTAVRPDGTRLRLITIKDWDFNWQPQYRLEQPLHLAAGVRLEMEFVYDNTARNPRNPWSPPKRVVWGPESSDEMAGLHLQVIPERAEDAAELAQALWGKFMRVVGGRFYSVPDKE